jgi:hypothetical protein
VTGKTNTHHNQRETSMKASVLQICIALSLMLCAPAALT